ncbi:PilC/PilY family type IV pilus protein [Glaciimonas immobilis]|uniref:Tfp pilus tip-associated adhesin PilY1 n=1 Tax=Glaciimonas immobilis TaxID=728004 RepID=A0A840RTN6_9BURK|nr:PilC/PilY family type IV pilus protein [Glaciimonas immobilis]MBB5199961.1 Tfp pilus tip-associated adhesin PilY1 [Glaciimonas immobilis]
MTAAPVVSLHPNYPRLLGEFVMFGTGQLLTSADLTNQLKQAIYGIWDKPVNTLVPTRTNLQAQTLTAATGGMLTDTTTAVNWNTKFGWYDDLPVAGQRVVTAPGLLNGAFMATLNTPRQQPLALTASAVGTQTKDLTCASLTVHQANQQSALSTTASRKQPHAGILNVLVVRCTHACFRNIAQYPNHKKGARPICQHLFAFFFPRRSPTWPTSVKQFLPEAFFLFRTMAIPVG